MIICKPYSFNLPNLFNYNFVTSLDQLNRNSTAKSIYYADSYNSAEINPY